MVKERSPGWPPAWFGPLLLPVRLPYVAARRSFNWLAYEKRLGVSTATSEAAANDATRPDHSDYYPSRWGHLKAVLRDEAIGPEDVFLDLGAGLGRALVQAAQMPFRRVIGVEISPELSDAARSNLERMRGRRRCGALEVVTADVGEYEIPGDVTFVYLYNPFTGAVFARFLDQLQASIERKPRVVRVVYTNPIEETQLLARGAHHVRSHVRRRPTREWTRRHETRIYAIGPELA